jgi:exosortase/archaeosortase family protein
MPVIKKNTGGRFILTVVALVGTFLIVYRDDLLGQFLSPWVGLTARMTLAVLHLLGIEAVRVVSQIHHPGGFAYEIYYRCTGVLPVAILTSCITAFPASWRCKGIGLASGVPLLIALNLVRLVHLFYLGAHAPAAFDLAHRVVWEAVLISATVLIWWLWSKWAVRSQAAE